MLEKQLWMKYADDLVNEWCQAKDEGKQVDSFKELCEDIQRRSREQGENVEKLAREIGLAMQQMTAAKGYPYNEPSVYEAIQQAKPEPRHQFSDSLTEPQKRDKLAGAWIGRISGCLLGKPVEGWKRKEIHDLLKESGNMPLSRYMEKKDFRPETQQKYQGNCWADAINGIAPVDDDTNYTVFGMKLIEQYGKDFCPNDVLEAWLAYIPMFATCTAERVAYRNAAMGMYAPETAEHFNPFREWIGAQIRGDFFGYINPGNPVLAAEMAWRDASISHVKNGIYGEMFVAAMIAAAAVCDDVAVVIQTGLDEIPEKSRLRRDIEKVIEWHSQGKTPEQAMDAIHAEYDEHSPHGWCHTNSNAMIVVLALLYGDKEFGKSLCLAVQDGFDTDCNGATVGSIVGIMLGAQQIPEEWYRPYSQNLLTSIMDYNQVNVQQLVDKTMRIMESETGKL